MQSYRVIHQHFHHSNLQVQVQPLPVTLDGHLSKTSRSSQCSFAKLHLNSLQKGMIWYGLPRTLWTPRAGNLQRIKFQDFCQDRGASNEKGEKQNIIFLRKKNTTLKPNKTQRTCGIHQWLAPVPWRKLCQAYSKHIQRTFETPEPKTQFGKSPSKDGNLPNGFREVKGRESLTHFETPMASSEICYCYMEWWHIPTESSTGCGRLQEINWHKQKLRTSSAIAPISKIYSVVACALINRKTDKQTMILGVGLSIHLFVVSPEYMGLIGSSVYLRISVCRLIRLLVHGLCQSACIASLVHQLLVGLSVYRCAGQNFESATPAQCHSMLTFTSGTMWQGGKSLTEHHIAYWYCTHVINIKSYMCRVQDLWNCRIKDCGLFRGAGLHLEASLYVSCQGWNQSRLFACLGGQPWTFGLLTRASLNKSRQFRCGHKNLQEMESHLPKSGRESETWKGKMFKIIIYLLSGLLFFNASQHVPPSSRKNISWKLTIMLCWPGLEHPSLMPFQWTWQNEPSHGPTVHHKVPKKAPWDAKLHPTFVYVWGLRAICSVLGITFVPHLRQRIRSHSSCLAIWLQSVATTERCQKFEFVVLLPIGQEMPKKREKKHIPILQISSHWSKCSQQAKHMSLQSNCLQPSRHMSRLTWSKITL